MTDLDLGMLDSLSHRLAMEPIVDRRGAEAEQTLITHYEGERRIERIGQYMRDHG